MCKFLSQTKLVLSFCFLALSGLAAFLASTPAQAIIYYTDAYLCTREANSNVNLRTSYSTSARIVHKIPNQTLVYILSSSDQSDDDYVWHLVTTKNGKSGWARGDFVCARDGVTRRLYK